jgi:hypothetical protein
MQALAAAALAAAALVMAAWVPALGVLATQAWARGSAVKALDVER